MPFEYDVESIDKINRSLWVSFFGCCIYGKINEDRGFELAIGHSAVDAGIKMRPTNESMSPEFDRRWSTYFANAPDKPVMLMIPFAGCVHLILINHTFKYRQAG